MAQQTQETLGTKDVKVLADRGYFSGEEILKCEQAGATPGLAASPVCRDPGIGGILPGQRLESGNGLGFGPMG